MPRTPTSLKIAVLLLPPVQLLDLAPVDLFHMTSKQYLSDCNLPPPLVGLGVDSVQIRYVVEREVPATNIATAAAATPLAESTSKEEKKETDWAALTASAALRVTHDLADPEVQPGQVDVLFVPGPDPNMATSEAAKEFIRAHVDAGSVVMSVCTGIIPLGRAGVLDGRVCTGPRALLGLFLRKDFPSAKWVEKRWAVDFGETEKGGMKQSGKGALWTAGGITNGNDMVAAWLRGGVDHKLADLVCAMADVGGREQEYGTSGAREGVWFGWLLLRSWFAGFGTAKG